MELLEFLINELRSTSNSLPIELLAKNYLRHHLNVSETSIEYCSKLMEVENQITRTVKRENKKFTNDNSELPFEITGSSKNLLRAAPSLLTLENSIQKINEDPNDFSNRLGKAILNRMGCFDHNIHITANTKDQGIDYWGEVEIAGVISNFKHSVLVIGQVKQYSGTVPVGFVREFVGSIQTALATDFFGKQYNEYSPRILQFVTTGQITQAGKDVANVHKIHLITQRHLAEMGILLDIINNNIVQQ